MQAPSECLCANTSNAITVINVMIAIHLFAYNASNKKNQQNEKQRAISHFTFLPTPSLTEYFFISTSNVCISSHVVIKWKHKNSFALLIIFYVYSISLLIAPGNIKSSKLCSTSWSFRKSNKFSVLSSFASRLSWKISQLFVTKRKIDKKDLWSE